MAIIVETGEIVANANSYMSEADLTAFATARGITLTNTPEILLIQAMDYIESLSYQGRKKTSSQPLQWPRIGVYIDGYYFPSDEIPQELKDGLAQTAIAIDEGNSPLQDSQRKTTSERVGDIAVTYSESSSSSVINRRIGVSLNKLLISGGYGGNQIDVRKA